jgi:hypothetical protein
MLPFPTASVVVVVVVVVSKQEVETGAGLSPRSAPTSRRLHCTFIYTCAYLLDTMVHAARV